MATFGRGRSNGNNDEKPSGDKIPPDQEDLCPACGGVGIIRHSNCEVCGGFGVLKKKAYDFSMAQRNRLIMERRVKSSSAWPDYYTDFYPDFVGPPLLIDRACDVRRNWQGVEAAERRNPDRPRITPLPPLPSWKRISSAPMFYRKTVDLSESQCPMCNSSRPQQQSTSPQASAEPDLRHSVPPPPEQQRRPEPSSEQLPGPTNSFASRPSSCPPPRQPVRSSVVYREVIGNNGPDRPFVARDVTFVQDGEPAPFDQFDPSTYDWDDSRVGSVGRGRAFSNLRDVVPVTRTSSRTPTPVVTVSQSGNRQVTLGPQHEPTVWIDPVCFESPDISLPAMSRPSSTSSFGIVSRQASRQASPFRGQFPLNEFAASGEPTADLQLLFDEFSQLNTDDHRLLRELLEARKSIRPVLVVPP